MKLSQEQIIWVQEWLARLEANFELEAAKLRHELYRMKKDLDKMEKESQYDPYMGTHE